MPGFSNRWRFRGPTGEGSIGEETTVDVRGPLLTSNAIALKQCALAGMGILLQARWILGRELRQGTLVDLFPHHQATAAHFHNNAYILYPTRTYLPLKVRVFVDFLTEKFRDGAPWEGAGLADS
jgi:DNA-binding transcriptional LysR family regulator